MQPSPVTIDVPNGIDAVVFGLDYLVTWNCSHIANADSAKRIAAHNVQRSLFMPMIVTPEWFGTET
jgi:hypothetical protein